MATIKRTSGDYAITTVDPTANVDINTNTLRITGNLTTSGAVSFPTADITANTITAAGNISAGGNLSAGTNIVASGSVTAAGNITGAVFIGDGSGLTGVPAGNALGNIISFGTSQVAVPGISGPVFVNVAGVSNIAVFSSGGANLTGNLNVTGNLDVAGNTSTGNILSSGFYFANGQPLSGSVRYDATPVAPSGSNPGDFWFNTTNGITYQYNNDGDTDQWVDASGLGTPAATTSVVANSVILRDSNGSAAANVWQGTGVLVTGNITTSSGYFIGDGSQLSNVGDGTSITRGSSSVDIPLSGGEVLFTIGGSAALAVTSSGLTNRFANGVGNIGNSTGYFNTIFAKATSAQYADLAEIYQSDHDYLPGTVLMFGGEYEVTISSSSHDPRVAGVVSTEPAYLMNSALEGVRLALVGKVPCRVLGPVTKGDLLVTSDRPGVAQKMDHWVPGSVLGKALADVNDGVESTINIVVGRH